MTPLASLLKLSLEKRLLLPSKAASTLITFGLMATPLRCPLALDLFKTALVLHYNQHEIASYRDAPVVVSIPLDQVKAFMK